MKKKRLISFSFAFALAVQLLQTSQAQTSQFECLSGAMSNVGSSSGVSECFALTVEDIGKMPMAFLTVDFHFVKSNNNNFQCEDPLLPYYAPTYVDQILGFANFLASNPEKNQFGNSPKLKDMRIRYKLSGEPNDPCSAIFIHNTLPATFSNPDAFHIIVYDNGRQTIGGATSGSSSMELFNIHYFVFEEGWLDASSYGNVIHHEFGHVFGLCHSFSTQNTIADMNPSEECGGPSDIVCGSMPCPSDAPGSGHPSCGGSGCFTCYCTWGTGNNFMGYTLPQIGVTQLQWAQVYGSIYSTRPSFASFEENCDVSSQGPLIIPGGQFVEWNSIRILNQPLVIETGAILVVRCEVKVGYELPILVQRGARLIVEGGKITSKFHDCKWGGIYVLGNTSMEQPDVSVAQNYFANIPPNGAGVVWINGGIIENAITGIHTKGYGVYNSQSNFGGLVLANSSDFINNGRAVEFMKYSFPNKSYLKDVDVKRSGSPAWNVNRGVSIWACSDIVFEEVRFEGMSEYDISGINFTAKVKKCSFKNLESNGFTQNFGFKSENTAPNIVPNSSTLIDDCDFELLKFDISCNSTPNMIYPLRIKNSRFKKRPSAGLMGIRIVGESAFTIGAGNEFNKKRYAIFLSATGSLTNSVSCNFFGESELVEVCVNTSGNNAGLEITGNDFLENTTTEIQVSANSSIHETQGKLTRDADNCFFNPVNAIKVTANATPFKYYIYDLNGQPVFCEKPTNNLSDGGTNNYSLGNSSEEDEACDYSLPPVTPNDLGPARQDAQLKKMIWQADPANELKYLDYLAAKDWQAYVLRSLVRTAADAGDWLAAESYLLGENSNEANREVVGIRFSRGDISAAQNLLNNMVDENLDDTRFKHVMAINFAIDQYPDPAHYSLTPGQYSQLEAIANDSHSLMRGYACALLNFCTGSDCEDFLAEEGSSPGFAFATGAFNSPGEVTVFPNPSSGAWNIHCPGRYEQEIVCQIFSLDGRMVHASSFVNTGTYTLLADGLPNGVYQLRLFQDNEIVHQEKVLLIR